MGQFLQSPLAADAGGGTLFAVREGAEPRLVMKQIGAAPFEWRMCGDDTDNIQITDAAAAP